MESLAEQLRYASPGAAMRQMKRAEDLIEQIEADRTYPEEWVVFSITGYRPEKAPDGGAAPTQLVGAALLGDLSMLVERLSVVAEIKERDLRPAPRNGEPAPGSGWLDAAALCARWKISRKTLDRYRRRGLPARRVVDPERTGRAGRQRLLFNPNAVASFEARHRGSLEQAGRFTRIQPELEARIVRLAARAQRRFGWSLNAVALRLAERTGRGHETIRQLLRRQRDEAGRPVFDPLGPLTARARRFAERAHQRGIEPAEIARRLEHSKASIFRALAQLRADRLRGIATQLRAQGARAGRPDKRSPLAARHAREGLGAPAPATLGALLLWAAENPVTDPRAEAARALACRELRAQAAGLIAALPAHAPLAADLDRIETMLRWSSRLKAELVRSQLPLVLKTIPSRLGRDITSFQRTPARSLLSLCTDTLIEATGRFDPSKGGRLAAPCSVALTRAVAHWAAGRGAAHLSPAIAGRATVRLDPASLDLPDWTRTIDPWQGWLEPDPRVRPVAAALPVPTGLTEPARTALLRRHGWDGAAPATLTEIAALLKTTVMHATRLEHRALHRCLEIARAAEGPT